MGRSYFFKPRDRFFGLFVEHSDGITNKYPDEPRPKNVAPRISQVTEVRTYLDISDSVNAQAVFQIYNNITSERIPYNLTLMNLELSLYLARHGLYFESKSIGRRICRDECTVQCPQRPSSVLIMLDNCCSKSHLSIQSSATASAVLRARSSPRKK